MKQYSAYQESDAKWAGAIPKSWACLRFKDLSVVNRGASPRPIDDPKYFDDHGDYSWVRIADLSASERYLLTTKQKLSQLGASLSVKRYPGDFFLSIAGTVGKPIITKIKCCIHDGFVWFPNLKINSEFLYYLCSTGTPYQGLGKLGTQLNLNTETVGNIFIPIPPKKEIDCIVSHLDRETEKIDKKLSGLEKKAGLYKELKQSLINETVTRGLPPKEAKKAGLTPKPKMKDSGIPWIGEIPEHWEVRRIGTAFEERSDRVNDTDYPPLSVTMKGIVPQLANAAKTQHNDNRKKVCEGDYVINSRSDRRGSSGVSPLEGSVSVINIVLKPMKKMEGSYLHYLFRSYRFIEEFYRNGRGIVDDLWTTKYDFMRAIQCSFPQDTKEQQAIASYLDRKTTHIDKIITSIEQQIRTLKELRKTLINDVVTGKICVI